MDEQARQMIYGWVQDFLGMPDLPRLSSLILDRAVGEVVHRIPAELRAPEGHDSPRYGQNSPELVLWKLGVICEAWSLEILRRKAEDGHCYVHPKPCTVSREFHSRLMEIAASEFEQVVSLTRSHARPSGLRSGQNMATEG